jgi:hypothetical protein
MIFDEEKPRREVFNALREKVAREFPRPWWLRILDPFSVRLPIYQPVMVFAAAVVLWMFFAHDAPKPVSHGKAPVVVDKYDASQILALDPDVL